ncbi:type II toxin-antitoxin system HicA family toxin [Chitinibacter sp. GC72]|uniref:type II toxin-antitoxin system HicA family toxin n=1 Tax=Chitinibacter sp. GC72 TaxID=1526917 RepID=UPI0012F74FCE|nr:type II toxin-antitoxin system HicA family toxin [Chitinibacter sp. GC72]
MDSTTLIKILKANGWQLVSSKGSHQTFKHPDFKELVTVKHPQKDIPTGTLNQHRKKAGLK